MRKIIAEAAWFVFFAVFLVRVREFWGLDHESFLIMFIALWAAERTVHE